MVVGNVCFNDREVHSNGDVSLFWCVGFSRASSDHFTSISNQMAHLQHSVQFEEINAEVD